MERMQAYTTPTPDSGVHIDTEGKAVDLITFMKAGGFGKGDVMKWLGETWDQVQVRVTFDPKLVN